MKTEVKVGIPKILYGCAVFYFGVPIFGFIFMMMPLIGRMFRVYHRDTLDLYYFLISFVLLILTLFYMFWHPFGRKEVIAVSNNYIELKSILYNSNEYVQIKKKDIKYCWRKRNLFTFMDEDGYYLAEKEVYRAGKLERVLRQYHYHVVHEDPFKHEFQKWYRDHPILTEEENGMIIDMIQQYSNDHDSQARNIQSHLKVKGIITTGLTNTLSFRKVVRKDGI